jgi:hypothetical protein
VLKLGSARLRRARSLKKILGCISIAEEEGQGAPGGGKAGRPECGDG